MARQRTLRRVYGGSRVYDRLSLALFARQHPRSPVALQRHDRSTTVIAAHAGCVGANFDLYEVRELDNPRIVNYWRCAFCAQAIVPPQHFPAR